MITTSELWAFIKAFPAAIELLKSAIATVKELELKRIDSVTNDKIAQLETEIARIKHAQTNADIASSISTINRG